jgi:hypothetical protein
MLSTQSAELSHVLSDRERAAARTAGGLTKIARIDSLRRKSGPHSSKLGGRLVGVGNSRSFCRSDDKRAPQTEKLSVFE